MNEVKPDPNDPLEKLKTTYYVEFICIEKTTRTLKDRSEPKFFEIPGKFLIHKQAEQTYKNQYEERIKKENVQINSQNIYLLKHSTIKNGKNY